MPRSFIKILLITLIFTSCNISENKRNRYFVRANEYLENRDYTNAVKFYGEAVRVDPDFASGWNNKGIAHFELGQYSEAIGSYNNAILADPERIEETK